MNFIITIDGPAGAGKGTLARALALHYKYALLETGLLYRCVGMKALDLNISLDDEEQLTYLSQCLTADDLKAPSLRTSEASRVSSKVAVFHNVREKLLLFQRQFAMYPAAGYAGTILDGRDTGTVICPDAFAKFFITAQVEIRAQRRFKELQEKGIESIYTHILEDMIERDTRDSHRAEAPLRVAEDAIIIDTSLMMPEEVLNKAIAYVDMRCNSKDRLIL